MKVWAALAFVCFMGISLYVLLNEKKMRNPHKKVAQSKLVSHAKKIGERQRVDLPIELQRQQIDSSTVYKFESKNKAEDYELDEEELDAFTRALSGLRDARDAGKVQITQPSDVLNKNDHEKKYYEYDK